MRFPLSWEVNMAQKPSIPKGTRDFNPEQVAKRNYIFDVIKTNFQRFGFQPIETPSFENSDTLMGKYGEEGDRLIFKILNSGDYFKDLRKNVESYGTLVKVFNQFLNDIIRQKKSYQTKESLVYLGTRYIEHYDSDLKEFMLNFLDNNYDFIISHLNVQGNVDELSKDKLMFYMINDKFYSYYLSNLVLNSNNSSSRISEKALRYDLTVPFARYVVQHQNEIEFPFKRYQIQPVWRADRPQKGRFREFFQCDADVVGSTSLFQEIEFIQLYDAVFSALKLEGVTIKINNRKILSGIAEVIGASDKLIDFTVALDKLDKIGEEKVKEEMLGKGIAQSGIDKLQPLFGLTGDFESQIESLKGILNTSEEGIKGIEELEFINKGITALGLTTATLQLDVTLARGLNYYTGAIFEVSAPENVKMGSIGGGGRYDDLTGIFGLKDVSGVGISFGLDRIYLVLEELGLFPETVSKSVDVLFINFGNAEALFCLKAIKSLRNEGLNAELYPDKITNGKHMKKQMNHANKRSIPFVCLVGTEEMNANTYTLKNMVSGDQVKVSLEDLIAYIKSVS